MFGNLHPVCFLCLSVCIWLFYVMYMQKIFVIRHELHERIVDVTVRQLKTIPAVLTLSSRSHSQRSPTLFKKNANSNNPVFFCLFGWLVGLVWFVYSTILCLCRNGYSDWLRVVMGVDSNSMHTFMHVPSQPFGTLEGIVSAVDVKQLNSISTY